MFKKCKVVMLTTNEKVINKIGDICMFPYGINIAGVADIGYSVQHLYFLSDDEIKEGDWVYHNSGYVSRVLGFNLDGIKLKDAQRWTKDCKKIIATTDTSLGLFYDNTTFPSSKVRDYYLPKPSKSFIEKYIEQYNKENIITDVIVEYEGIEWLDRPLEYFPKINLKDNTIAIKRIKDTFTREEVIELLHRRTYETTKDIMDSI